MRLKHSTPLTLDRSTLVTSSVGRADRLLHEAMEHNSQASGRGEDTTTISFDCVRHESGFHLLFLYFTILSFKNILQPLLNSRE